MSLWISPEVNKDMNVKQLANLIAELADNLNFVINGNVDWKNVRARSIKAENIETGTLTANEIAANTITAEKMDVTELSAIAADLGHITAGLIEAVQIFGSYIATADGTYPRIEFSSAGNLLQALGTATDLVKITPDEAGTPMVIHDNGTFKTLTYNTATGYAVLTTNTGDVELSPNGDLSLSAGGQIRVDSWSKLYSVAETKTLQSELNSKADKGISTVVTVGDGAGGTKDLTFIDGVLVGVA